ncbi:hypothetical protein T11_3767 [Trichinella zimbabwensis]|uniref:Uncharacterized protein n=1 Tax=Trichinella zimbabwensis TaxID=268475 RepID=A0A0V1HL89_9BILA|nr:hypothetical protein T11_3767 [Trichinella zimbabwensis]
MQNHHFEGGIKSALESGTLKLPDTAPVSACRWCIHPYIDLVDERFHHTLFCYQEMEQFIKPDMAFTRFFAEPIMPTFQVVIDSDIYIIYIPKRQSLIACIHSCRKY